VWQLDWYSEQGLGCWYEGWFEKKIAMLATSEMCG
jgi:hypothetical protein